MKNTHLQHPEDTILTGDLSVFDWFLADSDLSVKIDGAPAIVWGTDPATGTFFVGTKAVFNKVKLRIAHSHDEIDQHYEGEVAKILHTCFDYLPHTDAIIQGDFVGFGGSNVYRPNEVTYKFDEVVNYLKVIIAPHTEYYAEKDLRDAEAYPLTFDLDDTEDAVFLRPAAWQLAEDFEPIVSFARQMSTMCEFMTPKQSARVQKQLNQCIRNGIDIDDLTQDAIAFDNDIDVNVLRLWKLVKSIKDDMLYICHNDGPRAYINGELCDGEGYVRVNDYGMMKLVNREVFSHANFNSVKSWA